MIQDMKMSLRISSAHQVLVQLCFGFVGTAAIIDAVASTKLFWWRRSDEDSSVRVQWPVRAFEATLGIGFLLGVILS
jgi:hypothetical protein